MDRLLCGFSVRFVSVTLQRSNPAVDHSNASTKNFRHPKKICGTIIFLSSGVFINLL